LVIRIKAYNIEYERNFFLKIENKNFFMFEKYDYLRLAKSKKKFFFFNFSKRKTCLKAKKISFQTKNQI